MMKGQPQEKIAALVPYELEEKVSDWLLRDIRKTHQSDEHRNRTRSQDLRRRYGRPRHRSARLREVEARPP